MPFFFLQRSGPECALLTKSNKAWGCGSIRKHLCVRRWCQKRAVNTLFPEQWKSHCFTRMGCIISTFFQANGHRQMSRKPTAFGPKKNPIQQRFEEKWLWLPPLSREHWTCLSLITSLNLQHTHTIILQHRASVKYHSNDTSQCWWTVRDELHLYNFGRNNITIIN